MSATTAYYCITRKWWQFVSMAIILAATMEQNNWGADAFGLTTGFDQTLKRHSVATIHPSPQRQATTDIMLSSMTHFVFQKHRTAATTLLASNNNLKDNVPTQNEDSMGMIPSSPKDRPLLAAIDALMLGVFAAVGRASHNPVDGSLDLLAVAQTAAPFVMSWFLVAPMLGCFTPMATSDWKESTVATTKAWIVAVPLGCVLRGIAKGYVPPLPFVLVTLMATWVLLVGGRLLYTALSEVYVEMF